MSLYPHPKCPIPDVPRFFHIAGAVEERRQRRQVATHVVVDCECGGWHVVPRSEQMRGAA